MNLMNYNLSTLGGRFNLTLNPSKKCIQHGALGMFMDICSELVCGVETEYDKSFFTFCGLNNNFVAVYMETTANSIIYTAVNKIVGYDLEMTLTSPFMPEDKQMNCAPFFYIDVCVKKNTGRHKLVGVRNELTDGILVFGVRGDKINITENKGDSDISYIIDADSRLIIGDFERKLKVEICSDDIEQRYFNCCEKIHSDQHDCDETGFYRIPFKDNLHVQFIWAAYEEKDFITYKGESHSFLYKKYFKDIDEIVDYAEKNRNKIMEKSSFFDSLVKTSSLSQCWKDFIGFTFQSYKMNTIWSYKLNGDELFSVWEGNCMYNLTVDVEYNAGLFYFMLFPDVVPGMLRMWADTERGRGFISHDVGNGYCLESLQKYAHDMPIEENCNFILMLYAGYTINENLCSIVEHKDVLKRLVRYILDSDTIGDGIPNIGVFNTIDDGMNEVQKAEKQTYLAIKSACALNASILMLKNIEDDGLICEAEERVKLIMNTVNEQLWHEDHYGLCLDDSFINSKTGIKETLCYKNDYSIYASNGLLYLLLSGQNLDFIDLNRIKIDIYRAYIECNTQYGCTHSKHSNSIWFSQNMWRDFIAAYLDIDILDEVDKYWEFQKVMNTGGFDDLYIDTWGKNALWYYPRGVVSFGVFLAMIRFKINVFEKEVKISPIRKNVRIPLIMFADWKNKKVPWVTGFAGEVFIENKELIEPYKIIIE